MAVTIDTNRTNPPKLCPFKPGSTESRWCTTSCALYSGKCCGIVGGDGSGGGKYCPIMKAECAGGMCALYDGGCYLTKHD